MKYRSFLFFLSLLPLVVAAQNLTGRITCDGRGVRGVPVSDGDAVTVTDSEGRYALQSEKRNGYVFYTLPRGYEPEMADGFNPQFWARLQSADLQVAEEHNFQLVKRKNDNYRMIIGADTHLAQRIGDLKQFREGFIPCLDKERQAANGQPVYSMLLGDLTWDKFWTRNNYNLHDFLRTCREMNYSVPLFPVIGNHDNDPSVPASSETDFLASGPWRDIICPNYYSFNLGRVHYVVLDDIVYKNEDTGDKYAAGVVGSRNYDGKITEEQFRWLEKDLSYVSRSTPIVVALHIPVTRLDADFSTITDKLAGGSTLRLFDALKEYKNVHVVSGHTHYNYHTHPAEYPNVMEHNIAAVCATWWGTGYVSGRHLCTDGTPGGYSLWSVKGKKLRWEYHSMEPNGELQMRVFDMNAVRDLYRNDDRAKDLLAKYPNRQDYGQIADNLILVNCFAYDDDWKVEILEEGRPLDVKRVWNEDPLHTLAYDLPLLKTNGKVGGGSQTRRNTHSFEAQASSATSTVTVRVTDSFGRKHEKTLRRPATFSLSEW